jgi:hypothetical protein
MMDLAHLTLHLSGNGESKFDLGGLGHLKEELGNGRIYRCGCCYRAGWMMDN